MLIQENIAEKTRGGKHRIALKDVRVKNKLCQSGLTKNI